MFFRAIPSALCPHVKFFVVLRESVSHDLSVVNHWHMKRENIPYWTCAETRQVIKAPGTYDSYMRRGLHSVTGAETTSFFSEDVVCACAILLIRWQASTIFTSNHGSNCLGRNSSWCCNLVCYTIRHRKHLYRIPSNVGAFLGLSGQEWSKLTQNSLPHTNSASDISNLPHLLII